MEARLVLKKARPYVEVIWGLVHHVPDSYYIEEASVCAKDVVAPHPQHRALADLGSSLQVSKTEVFPEMVHQFDEAKLHQQVCNNLAARVSVLIQDHIEISRHDGVLTLEALQGLLYIGVVGQRGQ